MSTGNEGLAVSMRRSFLKNFTDDKKNDNSSILRTITQPKTSRVEEQGDIHLRTYSDRWRENKRNTTELLKRDSKT
jgi:hypothetical protein